MILRIALTVCLLLPLVTKAESLMMLSGKVVTDSNKPIANAHIKIGDTSVVTSSEGDFSLELSKHAIYALDISASNFYSMRFSYSHFELENRHTGNVDLGKITLVAKKKERVLLAFGGDVMMGRRYAKPYFDNPILIHDETIATDTKAIVQYMAPYIKKADFAAVNLESQIADKTPTLRAPKSVTFFSPPETISALKDAGVDYVTLGNNHTYDYLDSGLKSTLEALNYYQMPYSGAGVNEAEALKAYRTSIQGNQYAMLGYVGWEGSAQPSQTAAKVKGGAAHGSYDNIVATVKREVADNRVTVAQYHGSLEYQDEPSMMTETRLKAAIDAGADLAIAHHPHVAQGFEVYNGKLIAYSMGNFIFDQFFYATNHSFMLYVWMDGERFYRAEVVPVYLQGYVPTPATGSHRTRILTRLDELTSKRNTHFARNAGHGVILPNTKVAKEFEITLSAQNKRVLALPYRASEGHVTAVKTSEINRYRLGINLINNANLETHMAYYSHDRGFNLDQSSFQISDKQAFSGDYALKSQGDNGQSQLAMTNFTRVYRAGNPATVSAMVKGKGRVNVYWQGRKTRGKLLDSLKNGKKHRIDSIELNGNWQEIASEFNTPRVGYRSIRVLFEFEHSGEVFIDDIAFIEWRTPFLPMQQQAHFHNGAGHATYIGFEQPLKKAAGLVIKQR